MQVGGCIINNLYLDGSSERAYYAGILSKGVFSIIWETSYTKENPNLSSFDPYLLRASAWKVEKQKEFSFQMGHNGKISFPGRKSAEFVVKEVSPKSLTAFIRRK